jgi:hypothetical protein
VNEAPPIPIVSLVPVALPNESVPVATKHSTVTISWNVSRVSPGFIVTNCTNDPEALSSPLMFLLPPASWLGDAIAVWPN